MDHPQATVGSLLRFEDAIAALSVRLSDAEVGRLEELYQPHPATEAFS
jgi:hypothetical protein